MRNKVQKRFEMPRDKERRNRDEQVKLKQNYTKFIVQMAITQHDNSQYIDILRKLREYDVTKCINKLNLPDDMRDEKFAGTSWISQKKKDEITGNSLGDLIGGLARKRGGLKKPKEDVSAADHSGDEGNGKAGVDFAPSAPDEVAQIENAAGVHGDTESEIAHNLKTAA